MTISVFVFGLVCGVLASYGIAWCRRRLHEMVMALWVRSRQPYLSLLSFPLSQVRWQFGRIRRGWFRCQTCNCWANTESYHCQYWAEDGVLAGVCRNHR